MSDESIPDRGDEVAIAFVDLVQFTSLTEVHGDDAAADAAIALEASARRRSSDRVRLVKAIGDGLHIEASTPLDVLGYVGDLIEDVHELGLEARAGVDFGVVVTRKADVFGATVNLASRLAALAEPGMIAMTRPVALAAGESELAVTPLGPVRVKGFREPIEVFVVDPCRHGGEWLHDPICGMRLDAADAVLLSDPPDATIGFCSTTCADIFSASSDEMISSE